MKKLYTIIVSTLITTAAVAQISWTATPSSGCAPLTVTFTNTTTNPAAVNWIWYFGTGDQSTAFDSTFTYTLAGDYWVTLQAYDAGMGYLGSWSDYIYVQGSQGFTINYDTICPGDQVNVWGWNSGPSDYFEWDFGDGFTDANSWGSSNHTYPNTGNYTIQLIHTNVCGVDTFTMPVAVMNGLPVENPLFQLDPEFVCPGDEVNFWTNWDYTYAFDYGDGSPPTTNWYHVFDTLGTYQVSATMQNGCGNDTTLYDTVYVQNGIGINNNVYMSFWPDTACPGTEVSFNSDNTYSDFYWDFGDGNFSTEVYPEHQYATAGNYSVSVVITNGCGNDTTLFGTVVISTNVDVGYANIDAPDTVCPGDAVYIEGDSDNDNADLFQWDFGDGNQATGEEVSHAYASVGTYTITMTVTNGCGDDSVVTKQIVVSNNAQPTPGTFFYQVFPEKACPGDTVLFLLFPAGSNFLWEFGDGDTGSVGFQFAPLPGLTYDVVEHVYNTTGVYDAVMRYTNGCGNSFTDTISVDIGNNAIVDDASFMYDQTVAICEGQPMTFFGVGGFNYEWDFGDGTGIVTSDGSLNPVYHSYMNSGLYTVTMTAYNNCGNSQVYTDEIYVPETSLNLVTNSTASNCGINDGTAIVSVSGGDAPYSYVWSSGDTTVVADSLMAGLYSVTITDANGCSTFDVATVSDQQAPTILISTVIDVSCNGGNNGAIDINLIGSSGPYTYQWSNGATSEDVNQLQAGPYEVVVTDVNGCVATATINVTEPPAVSVGMTSGSATCGLSDGTASANVSGITGPYQYFWSNGQSTQTATGLSAGIYTVTVVDVNSCSVVSSVAVSDLGAPFVLIDSITQIDCGGSGSGIYISLLGGTAPYTFNWSTGATTEDLSGVGAGTYTVTVTDGGGCSSTQLAEISVNPPSKVPICLVTVDSASSSNLVVWEKPAVLGIKSFRLYRESSQAGLYYPVADIPYDSLSQYVDTIANPQIRSWRYKLTAIDSCDVESQPSQHHKTMHVTVNQGLGNSYNLIWDHYEGFGYSTYYVWRYSNLNGWEVLDSLPSNLTSYTDASPPTSWLIYYTVEIQHPNGCSATRAANYNSSRSNRGTAAGSISIVEFDNSEFDAWVFPNPTRGQFNLQFDAAETMNVDVRIYDMHSRVVKKANFNMQADTQLKRMNVSGVEAGMYMVQISTGTTSSIQKLIVH